MKYSGQIGTVFILSALSQSLYAAGFGIVENSGSGMGNAYAGGAVANEDASALWFNPAALSDLGNGTHISAAAHIIMPDFNFRNDGSKAPYATITQGTNASVDNITPVPNFYIAKRLNKKTLVGLGVNAPFGLALDYPDDWFGRYVAIDSELQTVNFNPSVTYEVNDKFSVGGGLNAQYLKVDLESAIDSAAVCSRVSASSPPLKAACAAAGFGSAANFANPNRDSKINVKGDTVSYGFNAGMMYKPTPKTRVGAHYRSGMKHKIDDGEAVYKVDSGLQAVLNNIPVALRPLTNSKATAEANVPASLSLSVAHKITPKLELMGDITRTQWSKFERLTINNPDTGGLISNVEEHWKDVNRYSLGATYQLNPRVKLRGGIAYDETPVPDATYRTPRTPDNDRTWVALGMGYQLNKKTSLDVGYAHIMLKDADINNFTETGYSARGNYEGKLDILSVQLNTRF